MRTKTTTCPQILLQCTIHLLDPENLVGDPDASADVFARMWNEYVTRGASVNPGDHVIVATSSHAAKSAWFALPKLGIRRLLRDGPDGADLALLDAVNIDVVSKRFRRLVIGSGDGIFAKLASSAQRSGMAVHQVIGVGRPSRSLIAECTTRSYIMQELALGADLMLPLAS